MTPEPTEIMTTEALTAATATAERKRGRGARDPAAVLRRLAARTNKRVRWWLETDVGMTFGLHAGVELTMAAYLHKIADELDRNGPDRVLERIEDDRQREAIEIGRGIRRRDAALFAMTASPFRLAESIAHSLLDPEKRAGDREWRRRSAARRRADVVQQEE